MSRCFKLIAAASGLLCVALGAFGAHALKGYLGPDDLAIWHTAVHYQFFHTLALLVIGITMTGQDQNRWIYLCAGWCFLAGILFFSGSLYLLSFFGIRWLGAITPIGGLLFLAGWASLFVAAWREPRKPRA